MIQITVYDQDWPVRFRGIAAQLADALSAAGVQVLGIEHVGSTAVPGLAARPIIDCDVIVERADVHSAYRRARGTRVSITRRSRHP